MSRVLLFLALALLLVTTCCTHNSQVPAVPYSAPGAILTLNADVDFDPTERAYINEAAANLAKQTNGYLIVRVTFDLDFNDMASLHALEGADLLIKIGEEARPVKAYDAEHCCLLGLTAHQPNTPATVIYLVADRLLEVGVRRHAIHDVYVCTAMHEMLHALGLNHVSDPQAVMAPSVGGGPSVVLHPADYDELHRVYGASIYRLSRGRF